MQKDRSARGPREHIAHLAARLIAQDHVADYSAAKRKATRQLGLPEGRNLPTNQEIEQALRSYRELYQPDHGAVIVALRQRALAVMMGLDAFQPWLVGSVLSGIGGSHSDINLIVYSDDPKSVEFALLARNVAYRVVAGPSDQAECPTLTWSVEGTDVTLAVRPANEERSNISRQDGAPERLRSAGLRALMQASEAAPEPLVAP